MALTERYDEAGQHIEPDGSTPSLKNNKGKTKEQYWRRHLQQWRASGLNQTEYCRRSGINRHSFVNWKRKLGIASRSRTNLVAVPPEVVRGIDRIPPVVPLAVIVNGRFRVEVPPDFDQCSLQRLVSTLERI